MSMKRSEPGSHGKAERAASRDVRRVRATKPAHAFDATSAPEATRSIRIRTFDINGQSLRVAVWPAMSTRTPLLLFNGIGVGFEALTPLANAMPDVETIAFDVPGAGESPLPAYPYRLWMLARLAGRLLDKLGYDQVDVLGVSWGGALAQQFALQNPRRCRRLVLAATISGPPMVPGRPSVLLKLLTPRRFTDRDYLAATGGELYGGAARTGADLMDKMAPLYGRTSRLGYLYQQLAILGWSSAAWLPLLPQRTLIIAGSDDPIVPVINAQWMGLLIRHSRVHIVDDGHLFIISNASGVGQVIDQFLSE